MEKKQIVTIPNILCLIRILLVPLFVVLYLRAQDLKGYLIAASVILVCSLTDFLDGFIARKCNMISEVGKILDPFADKFLQCGIALSLMFKIEYMYLLFIVFMVKEITMFVFQAYLYKHGKRLDGALWYGKVATAVFYLFMMIMTIMPNMDQWILDLLMLVVGGFLIMAFVLYMIVFAHMYTELQKERRQAKSSPEQIPAEEEPQGNRD